MTDEQLVSAFEAGVEPPGGFHHREHVRVAFLYLQQGPLSEALGRFVTNLKHFAEKQGASQLYHETITVAFVLLINERLADGGAMSWTDFEAQHADLLSWKPSVLDRYYREETLWSDRARRGFVMPDRIVT